ncbi:MAG: DUF3558 family protein [Sciscionella sp.]
MRLVKSLALLAATSTLGLAACTAGEAGRAVAVTPTAHPGTAPAGPTASLVPSAPSSTAAPTTTIPKSLTLHEVDACALLPAAQRDRFGLSAPISGAHLRNSSLDDEPVCAFHNAMAGYTVSVTPGARTSVAQWLRNKNFHYGTHPYAGGATVGTVTVAGTAVAGYPAVRAVSSVGGDCTLAIKVAVKQQLNVAIATNNTRDDGARLCPVLEPIAVTALRTLESME